MNTTKQLLHDVGDQQFLYCAPRLHDCRAIEAYVTHLAVLKRFWPVLSRAGLPIRFGVLTVWASDAGETRGFSVSFSLN